MEKGGCPKQQVAWEQDQTNTREHAGWVEQGIFVNTGQRVARREAGRQGVMMPVKGVCSMLWEGPAKLGQWMNRETRSKGMWEDFVAMI